MIRRLALAFALWLAACVHALAFPCSAVPNVFVPNTLIQSSQINANFNSIAGPTGCITSSGAANGANSDITSLSGLTTPLSLGQGGTADFIGGNSTGSANAQVVATTTPNSFALTAGNTVWFIAGFTNTGATTLATGGTGATAVKKLSGSGLVALVANDIIATQGYWATFDGTQYELQNPSTTPINLASLPTKATPTTSDSVAVMDAAAGNAAKTSTVASLLTAPGAGTWTAGTTNTLNPFTNNSVSTQAHGLGAAPTQVLCALQNVNAELGYNVGDKLFLLTANNVTDTPFNVSADATNTYIATNSSAVVPSIINRSTKASATITAANWKLVCIPYKIN